MTKTIIIADDHPFIVEGMSSIIQSLANFNVVATATNGIEAIAVIKKLKPDCAILDLSMPGANGLDVFKDAKRWSPKTKFVIVTGISAAVLFQQLYDEGIDGLFVKNTPPEKITDGIIRVCNGERIISDEAIAAINGIKDNKSLSQREIEVLNALARGQSNKEIAKQLNLSPRTVDSHRTNLLRKMNVSSTAALLVKAMRIGLLDI